MAIFRMHIPWRDRCSHDAKIPEKRRQGRRYDDANQGCACRYYSGGHRRGIELDPGLAEQTVADSKLTIASNQDGSISAMQKTGEGMLTFEQLLKAVDMACAKAEEIRGKYLMNN